jgi:hypothetical protein
MSASKEGVIMAALKAIADKYTERFISRKFLAWLTATGLCVYGTVTSGDWVAVTLAYIGSQALVDLAVQWKHGKK